MMTLIIWWIKAIVLWIWWMMQDYMYHHIFMYCMHLYMKKVFDVLKIWGWRNVMNFKNFSKFPLYDFFFYSFLLWFFLEINCHEYSVFGYGYMGFWFYFCFTKKKYFYWSIKYHHHFCVKFDVKEVPPYWQFKYPRTENIYIIKLSKQFSKIIYSQMVMGVWGGFYLTFLTFLPWEIISTWFFIVKAIGF